MIWAAPGSSFEATVSGFPTGLAGTIGVRIRDNVGADALARTTAGIVEDIAGSGFYRVTLTAPTLAGVFTVFWDTGVVSPTTTHAEELVVTSSSPAGAVPSGSDLTTIAAVKEYLDIQTTTHDGVLQSAITRASAAIMRYARREFAPAATTSRSFAYAGGGMLDLGPYDLRSASSIQIDTDTSGPTTLALNTDYAFRPLNGSGVYGGLWLKSIGVSDRPGMTSERVVTITGDWGFASVPPDVEQACIITVAVWFRRDVAAFSATFSLDESRIERPEALPSAVRGLLAPWRRVTVA